MLAQAGEACTPGIKRVFAWSFYSQGSHQQTFTNSQDFFSNALPFFGFTGDLPKNDDDKARELAKCLDAQPGLLLLDGLEPLQHPPQIGGDMTDVGMKEFLLQLHRHRHPQSFVLISSRQALVELDGREDYRAIPLDTLSDSDGAALLQALKVQGTEPERLAVSRDLMGHALSLVLLATILKQHKGGDIRYAKELPPLGSEDSPQSGHAKRVLRYYDSLLSEPERRFMHCLALFDRPMRWQEQRALFAKAEHAAPLAALSDQEWQNLQQDLETKRLLLKDAESGDDADLSASNHRTQWDTHPLIRQYFAVEFQQQHPRAFQQAHNVLFEYFQEAQKQPQRDSLAELEQLYRAVVHGCLAGEYQKALDEIYWKRILRGNERYSLHKLGTYSQDLIALSAFFPQGWLQPPVNSGLTESNQAWLLAQASFCLMSLGRLAEAVAPREAATKLFDKLEDWEQAATSAGTLTDLLLSIGKLLQAEITGQQGVDYARSSEDKLRQMVNYSRLATVLHRLGQSEQAHLIFAHAELLQRNESDYPYLYSLPGAQYCALLLDSADNTAELEHILQRGEYGLKISARNKWLFAIAFDHLTLARTYQVLQHYQSADTEFNLAVQAIQKSGKIEFMPEFHLARADFYLNQNDLTKAEADIKTANHTINRCGMTLYAADAALLQARYSLTTNNPEAANKFYNEAEMLIDQTGYHLRDKALAELKQNLMRFR